MFKLDYDKKDYFKVIVQNHLRSMVEFADLCPALTSPVAIWSGYNMHCKRPESKWVKQASRRLISFVFGKYPAIYETCSH